ncbi:MAG: zinc-binding dehydrogenase [Clostridiaceae bacterium]|jgi:threonine dehydrogenase-like Zn-dependent dehydrogenase|nr:zinc-binding dehydrogenase [Clostridiaceae bacterium]
MKTTAVRMYGKRDLRLESFELPPIKDDEILAQIISDSICMSSYKAAIQGSDHKRVPDNIDTNPVIIGHEFCGVILEVGKKWQDQFQAGDRFVVQPALNEPDNIYAAPGYSFEYIGGNATHIIIPPVVMKQNCLLKYEGEAFFAGSLAEPVSCIVGGFNVNYHTKPGTYEHVMGIVEGGNMALLAGVGPMGLGAIDFAIHNKRKPGLLVVTDINQARLDRAASILTVEEAARNGVELKYVNTAGVDDVPALLRSFTKNDKGYDDIYIYAPVRQVVEQGDKIMGYDACLNFFAGPNDPNFTSEFNFYDVHYNASHIAGNTGGNAEDLFEALELLSRGVMNPSAMVTHIGGLDAAIETTLNLPNIPGSKKLLYTNISMPLTAIDDFAELGKKDPLFRELDKLVQDNNGLWSVKAEQYLLEHGKPLSI